MADELWHADIEVNEALVRACIEGQFPELLPLSAVKCIDEGWDNVVYLINNTFIFRFPRRQIAIPFLLAENKLLLNLQHRFDLEIPNPQFIGEPSAIYPYPFQGYKKIVGDACYQVSLSIAARKASIKPLALFLKELHSIKHTEALQLGAAEQVWDRMEKDKIFQALRERIEKIKAKNIISLNDQAIERLFTLAADTDLTKQNKVLIHGDMYFRHLLFNQGKLTGIIDWGDAGINHAAVDLMVIHSFYPASEHEQFFKYYGNVDKDNWLYAKFLGMYVALTIILYAHDRQDHLMLNEAVKELDFSLKPCSPSLCLFESRNTKA